jgi:putative transposase
MADLLQRILCRVRHWASAAGRKLAPFAEVPPTLVDAVRSRRELLLENALLRHQIVVLRRRVPRPILTPVDRLRLLLAARLLPGWRIAVALVQPQTILRWHRLGFRLFWRHKSRSLPRDQLTSGRDMAAKNRLGGAERIRGELLKIGVRVSKRTIQKYMRSCRRKPAGQTWSAFIKNHA